MPLMHRTCHSGCNIYERIQKVLSEGTQLRQRFFCVDERREDPNTTITSGPSSVRQRDLAGVPMMVQH